MQAGRCKWREVFETLRREIRTGRYSADHALPSEAQTMVRFGVGRQTARRVFDELVHARLVVRRQGAGAFLSSNLRLGTGRIGLIVHGSSYCEIFAPIARRISHLCQSSGRTLLFADISDVDTHARVRKVIATAREYARLGVDGVIFQPVELLGTSCRINADLVKIFRKAGIPVVLLDSDSVPPPERSDCDLAAVNHFNAGRRLATHLRQQGAKRLAYLMQENRAPCVQERWAGIRAGAEGLELAGELLLMEPDDRVRIARAMKRLRPDAVACYNDRQAVLFVKTLESLGYRVPRDVLVAGFDDINYATIATPQLTSMHQPCEAIADLAFDMLLTRMRKPTLPPRETFLDAELTVRESTKRKTKCRR